MKRIEFQRIEQGCKNGAKRVRRPMQQIITGTQQAQRAIDDGNGHGIVNNHTLSFTGAFTRFGDRQGQKNATAVCCDLVTLQGERLPRSPKTTVTDGKHLLNSMQEQLH